MFSIRFLLLATAFVALVLAIAVETSRPVPVTDPKLLKEFKASLEHNPPHPSMNPAQPASSAEYQAALEELRSTIGVSRPHAQGYPGSSRAQPVHNVRQMGESPVN